MEPIVGGSRRGFEPRTRFTDEPAQAITPGAGTWLMTTRDKLMPSPRSTLRPSVSRTDPRFKLLPTGPSKMANTSQSSRPKTEGIITLPFVGDADAPLHT